MAGRTYEPRRSPSWIHISMLGPAGKHDGITRLHGEPIAIDDNCWSADDSE